MNSVLDPSLAASAPATAGPLQILQSLDPVLGLSLLVVLALVAGEAAVRWLRLPRLMGPILVGTLASPAFLGLFTPAELQGWKPLLDLAIGVLLFELGTRLQPRWLLDNPALALTCIAEGVLSFVAVSVALSWLGAPPLSAALAGAAAMASSPVLALCVVHDASPRGQVTNRLVLMTAVNSVLAVLAIKAWGVVAATQAVHAGAGFVDVLSQALWVLGGSFTLGLAAALLLDGLSRFGIRSNALDLLQMAVVLVASTLSSHWHLSALLTLLAAGVLARWRMGHRLSVTPQLGSAGQALTVLLLVALGTWSTLDGLWRLAPWVLALLVARGLAKLIAVVALARPSALGWRQALGLSVALQPMSSLVVLLGAESLVWPDWLPAPDANVLQALLIATTLTLWIGPLLIHWGLGRLSDEMPCGEKEFRP